MLKPKSSVSWSTFLVIFSPQFWSIITATAVGLTAFIFGLLKFAKVKVFLIILTSFQVHMCT
jgi:hypothetical protein